MAAIDYLSKGKLAKKDFSIEFEASDISVPAIHQVVKGLLAGRRQGNACTKTKAMVSGGGKKPFKQKGTGRARQGSSRSPLMPGGGTAHGPQPRSFEQKINKKLYLKALKGVLTDKYLSNALVVVSDFNSNGKTKDADSLIKSNKWSSALLVCATAEDKMIKACRNLKNAKAVPVSGLSVYDMIKYNYLVVDEDSFKSLSTRVGSI